jgi:hypothetical protein
MREVKLLRLELLIEIEPGLTAIVKWEEPSRAAIRMRKHRARQKAVPGEKEPIPVECNLIYNHYARTIRAGKAAVARKLIWQRLKGGLSVDYIIAGITAVRKVYDEEHRTPYTRPRADTFFAEGEDFDCLYLQKPIDPDEGRPFIISPEGYKIFTDGKP